MIRFDYSPGSVVVICSCGWRDVFTARVVALRVAATHEDMHDRQAAAKELRARHAKVIANAKRNTPM